MKHQPDGKSRFTGLILGFALISNENPNFEMSSTQSGRRVQPPGAIPGVFSGSGAVN